MNTFHIAATGEQPLLKLDLQMERWLKHRDIIGNQMNDAFVWSDKGYIEIYYSDVDAEGPIYEDGKKLLDPAIARRVIEEIRQVEPEFWTAARKLRAAVEAGAEQGILLRLFDAFRTVSRKMHAYFMTSREEPMLAVEERLRELVKAEYGNAFLEQYILLTTPTEKDLLFYEKRDFVALARDTTDAKIKAHALKYPLMLFNVESEAEALTVLRSRLAPDEIAKLKHEIDTHDAEKQGIKERQEQVLARLPAEARELAWFIQQASITRLLLKNCWGGTTYFLLPFISYLSKRAGVTIRDIDFYATADEIARIIESGKWISSDELARRKDAYLLYFKYPEAATLYTGAEARKLKQELMNDTHTDVREFNGTIANKGKVRGKVRLIKVDSLKDIQQIAPTLSKDHILVTGMTNPTMMILVRKVAAIVTDEGGMACHAAIISREFGLPCLVGCKIATKVLKDGDIVEVDANAGIVKKI